MSSTSRNSAGERARPKRIRRTPEASRAAVLEAAQRLLATQGPAAVTLSAVAEATAMTHGNVAHLFGSSALLQAALIAHMAREFTDQVGRGAMRLRSGEMSEHELVDLVFEQFSRVGYGRLLGSLSASGRTEALEPIFAALEPWIDDLRAAGGESGEPEQRGSVPAVLSLVSLALTASLIGPALERTASMPSGSLRRLAVEELRRHRQAPAA